MSTDTDIWKLIAAPIIAMNEAEAANAAGFVELLSELAFEPQQEKIADGQAAPMKLRELSFETQMPDMDGLPQRHIINVPLIQLIPISGVAIDRAKIKYSLNAAALKGEEQSEGIAAKQKSSGAVSQAHMPADFRRKAAVPRLIGRLGQANGQKDGSAASDGNIEIEVDLRAVDMPAGFLDTLNFTRGSIQNEAQSLEEDPQNPIDTPVNDGGVKDEIQEQMADKPFSWRIREMPREKLKAGEPFKLVLDVAVNPEFAEDETLDIHITSPTSRALEVISPDEKVTVKGRQDIDVILLPTEGIKKLSILTRVGVLLDACGVQGHKKYQQFIDLPR